MVQQQIQRQKRKREQEPEPEIELARTPAYDCDEFLVRVERELAGC